MRQHLLLISFIFIAQLSFAASREPERSKLGMVVSTNHLASQVGADILKKGGNAVDASIAVGLALAVTWPSGGNIGGGGFMLMRSADGKSEVIDYRERAPLSSTRDMYIDGNGQIIKNASTVGYKAVGVPGTIAGFAMAHKRHGVLPWKTIVEPARKLAADGFIVNIHYERALKNVAPMLEKFEDSAKIFLRGKQNRPYLEGERMRQPDLAATLARIQKHGARDFYEGETAKLIAADMKKHGGLVTLQDLKDYEPSLRKPLEGRYRGFTILTMPPPSSGGAVLLQELNILQNYNLSEWGYQSPNAFHVLIEAMKHSFADRAKLFGDTDFVKVPLLGIIDPVYAKLKAQKINLEKATPSQSITAGSPDGLESTETTHYSVVDKNGMVVSNTYTLNGSFGAGAVAHKTGVMLNNEMDDFTSKPGEPNMYGLIQDEKNAIAPKKRPLSSMSPTIVLKDNKFYFSAGSPGGPTIINTVLQVVTNIVDFSMTAQEAVDAPRIHHQWMPDEIYFEPMGINSELKLALEKRGHVFSQKPRKIGDAHVILFDEKQGVLLGAADPRLGGLAVGL